MKIDIETRKIKHTPLKAVISGDRIIGVFDRNIFVEKKNMTEKQMKIVSGIVKKKE